MAADALPPPLDYAPPVSWHRRRIARRAAGVGVLLAITLAAWRWGPETWRRAGLLYWQRQCLRYAPPPDLVVYDYDAAGSTAVPPAGGEYVSLPFYDGSSGPYSGKAWGHVPRCASERSARSSLVYAKERVKRLPPGPRPDGPVLFMHELRTPAGAPHLVILRGQFWNALPPFFVPGVDVKCVILRPATWREPEADCTETMGFGFSGRVPPAPKHFRAYAGQPDPTDPTHFTFRYESDGKAGIVDGWLLDGEAGHARVNLKVRPQHPPGDGGGFTRP